MTPAPTPTWPPHRTKRRRPVRPSRKNPFAELTFGFWVLLTSSRHTTLLWNPHLEALYPAGSQRHKIHFGLDDMRKARATGSLTTSPSASPTSTTLIRRMRRYAGYISPISGTTSDGPAPSTRSCSHALDVVRAESEITVAR